MITMSVRNENIVNITEIYVQQLCVSYKYITRSCIKQNLLSLRLQKDRQAMLSYERAIFTSII